jgi:NAD-dependent SIR2 family protein deacetylase
MFEKLDNKYLHNNYFYLTCNCCDRLIEASELTEEQYNKNEGYCQDCYNGKYVY